MISCEKNINLDYLVQYLWYSLDLIRIYTKKKGEPPALKEAIILKRGSTIKTVCMALHKSFIEEFSHAHVWGSSAKHSPQRVGLAHVVHDEDIVQVNRENAQSPHKQNRFSHILLFNTSFSNISLFYNI